MAWSNRACMSVIVALTLGATSLGTASAQEPAVTIADACPAGIPTDVFDDVAAGDVHAEAIDCVAWYEVALGRAPGAYDPQATVTRGQMAAFLVRLLDRASHDLPEPRDQGFGDVVGHPFEDAINQLAELQVARGTSSDTFSPQGRVRRDQMASFIVRAHREVAGGLGSPGDRFDDLEGNPHESNVEVAAASGIVAGTGERTYSPRRAVSRAQMASFLARTLASVERYADDHGLVRLEVAPPAGPHHLRAMRAEGTTFHPAAPRVDGVAYRRSVESARLSNAAGTPLRIVYDLGGAYQQLVAGVGLRDTGASVHPRAQLEIFGDGRSLEILEVGFGELEPLDVDVTGVDELRLEILRVGDDPEMQSNALVLANARLLGEGATDLPDRYVDAGPFGPPTRYLDTAETTTANTNLHDRSVTIGGETYARGLRQSGIRAEFPAEFSFDLSREYPRLRGLVGLDDETAEGRSYRLEVRGDGRLLHDEVVTAGPARELDLDVDGVLRLELRMSVPPGTEDGARAAFADLRVER
jgi:hypothetical protein